LTLFLKMSYIFSSLFGLCLKHIYIYILRKSIKLTNENSKINNPSEARTSWLCHDLLIAWGALALNLREALCACALQIIIILNKLGDFLPVKTRASTVLAPRGQASLCEDCAPAHFKIEKRIIEANFM
jgi:hypothetical protein